MIVNRLSTFIFKKNTKLLRFKEDAKLLDLRPLWDKNDVLVLIKYLSTVHLKMYKIYFYRLQQKKESERRMI